MDHALVTLNPEDERSYLKDFRAAALYIKAVSDGRLGRINAALAELDLAKQFIQAHPPVSPTIPRGAHFGDGRRITAMGGDPADFDRLITAAAKDFASGQSFDALDNVRAFTKIESFPIDAELPGRVVPALHAIEDVWKSSGPFEISSRRDLDIVEQILGMLSQVVSPDEMKTFLYELWFAYLKREKLDAYRTLGEVPPDQLTPRLPDILRLATAANRRDDALALFDRYFEKNAPPRLFSNLFERLDLSADEFTSRLARAAARLPDGERGIPGTTWMRVASQFVEEGRNDEAWPYAVRALKGVRKKDPPDAVAQLFVTKALAQRVGDPYVAATQLCARIGVAPWMPRWWNWYNGGRRELNAGHGEKAAACFRVVLRFLDAPDKMDSTITMKDVESYGRCYVQGETDFMWNSEREQRVAATTFGLALALIEMREPHEAAALLRPMALQFGDRAVRIPEHIERSGATFQEVKIGIVAANLVQALHVLNGVEIDLAGATEPDRPALVSACVAQGDALRDMNLASEADEFYRLALEIECTNSALAAKRADGLSTAYQGILAAHGNNGPYDAAIHDLAELSRVVQGPSVTWEVIRGGSFDQALSSLDWFLPALLEKPSVKGAYRAECIDALEALAAAGTEWTRRIPVGYYHQYAHPITLHSIGSLKKLDRERSFRCLQRQLEALSEKENCLMYQVPEILDWGKDESGAAYVDELIRDNNPAYLAAARIALTRRQSRE